MRTVRVPRNLLVSFGSGKRTKPSNVDDDLEFFDFEIPETTVTITPYRQFKSTLPASCSSGEWKCMWCFSPAQQDDQGRYGRIRCHCGRLGVTQLEQKDKKHIYVEDI